jgi:uncharacterized protein YggE
MKSTILAGALSLVLAAAAAPHALAQTAPEGGASAAAFRATTLRLTAEGETKIVPDMATISLGVSNEAATAGSALQENAQEMAKVVAALRAAGIAERDIRTSQLSVNPQYAYKPNEPAQLTGYRAANQVTVTVRDLTRLGPTVDACVRAGANTVHGISFGLIDPSAAEDQARLAAVKALQAKAELYATATGYHVLRLVSLSEGGGGALPPLPVPMAAVRMDKASSPVSPGEETVRIEVDGVFELAR